ncbi:unnamed protein product [Caenorhabditis nigoni]
MPIRILSLPDKDFQYALNCMDIGDLVAFSLCSNRTRNLVKSLNRKIEPINAKVFDNGIWFGEQLKRARKNKCHSIIFVNFPKSSIEINHGSRWQIWSKQGFTQGDWIAHFMSIFNASVIHKLGIKNVCSSHLDTIKQGIQKCHKLRISYICPNDVARMALLKLAPISEEVEVENDIFDDKYDISKLLTLNLKSAKFDDLGFPFKITLDDLLALNITNLTIDTKKINEKELNRFLKLWMKGSHRFYRSKVIVFLRMHNMNHDEVLRGLKHQTVNGELQLKRADGKKVVISLGITPWLGFLDWILEFRG